jgi:hypothetical protein
LQESLEKHVEGMIIQKGNQLLYDYDAVTRKLKDFTTYTAGLEEHLREQISREFQRENAKLITER